MKKYKLLLLLVASFIFIITGCNDNKGNEGVNDNVEDKQDQENTGENNNQENDGDNQDDNNDNNQNDENTHVVLETYNVDIYDSEEDVDWNKVDVAWIDTYKWVDSDKFNSFGQLVFVNGYGFICKLSCEEENPYTQYHNDGDPVYKDSAMEFFVSLSSELGYINLETNSVGARLQQYSTPDGRVSVFNTIENGIKVDTGRSGKYWTLTIRLTLEDISKLYPEFDTSCFVSGYEFSGNFYKIGTNPETSLRHYGMWKEVGGSSPSFHQPSYFGKMILGNKTVE